MSEFERTQAIDHTGHNGDDLVIAYFKALENGQNAEDLVSKIIEYYIHLFRPVIASFDLYGDINDYLQACVEAILIALSKYDITRGVKFSTYVGFWIKRKMQDTYGEIRGLPKHKVSATRISSIYLSQPAEQDTDHTLDSLSKRFGLTERSLMNLNNIANSLYIEDIANRAEKDSDFGYDYITHRVNELDQNDQYQELFEKLILESILKYIESLNEINKTIFKMYYGLAPYERDYSSTEIAQELKISRRRVYKCIKNNIKKIRKMMKDG
jgi:RNA polymerase sigma factor for flagellar operon FliA